MAEVRSDALSKEAVAFLNAQYDLFVDFSSDSLVDAWVTFLLRYQFEWFITFTFRDAVGPEKADRSFRRWIHRLNTHLHGRFYWKRFDNEVYWVRATEFQRRGVVHFHALVADTNPLNERFGFNRDKDDIAGLLYWQELWFAHAGICRIEKIRVDEFVSRYVSKYVVKDGEIDVSANLRSYVPPQPGLLL